MKLHIDPSKLFTHNKLVVKRDRKYILYTLNGKYHNPNGPARVTYHENGKVRTEQYWIKNKLHRDNGPAYLFYPDHDETPFHEYWKNNKYIKRVLIYELD